MLTRQIIIGRGGANATVNLKDFSADSVSIDLTSTDYEDNENLRLYGDVQNIDDSDYEGTIILTGNSKANSVTRERRGINKIFDRRRQRYYFWR